MLQSTSKVMGVGEQMWRGCSLCWHPELLGEETRARQWASPGRAASFLPKKSHGEPAAPRALQGSLPEKRLNPRPVAEQRPLTLDGHGVLLKRRKGGAGGAGREVRDLSH
jgi:hypothetical protein